MEAIDALQERLVVSDEELAAIKDRKGESAVISAGDIIQHLVRNRWRDSFVLPNYTPANWWECDVFEVTKAGYWREYEVKVSRADFLADRHKQKQSYSQWNPDERPGIGETLKTSVLKKYDMLSESSEKGPNLFWYVTPKGLVEIQEIPGWAGLIELDRHPKHGHLSERVVRKAPKLHSTKCSELVRQHSLSVCYWRMWEWRRKGLESGRTFEFADGI